LTLRRLLNDYCRSRWQPLFREARAKTQQYDNERLGNCILIVGQVMAVGNTRL
jgi:hypothetical protein